jgi:hypothetical protein
MLYERDDAVQRTTKHFDWKTNPSFAVTQFFPGSHSVNMKFATTTLITSLGLLSTATPTTIVNRRAVGDAMCGGTSSHSKVRRIASTVADFPQIGT